MLFDIYFCILQNFFAFLTLFSTLRYFLNKEFGNEGFTFLLKGDTELVQAESFCTFVVSAPMGSV
jgi:hypothetical protein